MLWVVQQREGCRWRVVVLALLQEQQQVMQRWHGLRWT
jgi:hypothetical protein